MVSWHDQTLARLSMWIRSGDVSPIELVTHSLDRIDALDGRLGSFRITLREQALAEAHSATERLANDSDIGPLFGLPFAAKDLFDVAGQSTEAGTPLLAENVAPSDSAAVARLREAGMILVGKTHTVQLAYGGAGINHDTSTPHNPWHREAHLPGGSSSGSGVAVAAGLVPLALGTDTGGSVRIPASLCGLSGLKTTVGRVSRAGVYPLSWSLDSVGPLGRTVEDCALAYDVLAGADADDPTTWARPHEAISPALGEGVAGLRLGIARSVFWDDADPEVERAVLEACRALEALGAEVVEVEFPAASKAMELNPRGLVIAAEAFSLNRKLIEAHERDLDPIVGSRVAAGADVQANEYLAIVKAWQGLRVEVADSFAGCDAVLCPTTATPARPVAEVDSSIDSYVPANLLYLRNTAVGNILDLCGISVPCGFTEAGLPIGLMVYGRAFDEATVTRVAHAYQSATEWHRRRPDLGWTEG